MTKKEEVEIEKQAAIKELRKLARNSNYEFSTVLRHCSRSGMFRRISVFAMVGKGKDKQPYCIDHLIEKLGTYRREKDFRRGEGLKISGCGTDMGFAIVNHTSQTIFPSYSCRGEKCNSADHSNGRPRTDKCPHSDSYCIKQRWI